MPFDQAGYDVGRVLAPDEAEDLAGLRFIRDRLKSPGSWCQGKLLDSRGARCIVGWTLAARLVGASPHRLKFRLQGTLGELVLLIPYNDSPGRKKRHMQALVDRAIAKLEGV